jgi:glycosyltransferase involved in cell wall biosynthesis
VVVTIHDMVSYVLDDYRLGRAEDLFFRAAIRRADHLVTVSETSRQDLVRLLDVPAQTVTAIPLGADGPLAGESAIPAEPGPAKDEPYWLFIGGIERRKNLVVALRAIAGEPRLRLRVVGPAAPAHREGPERLLASLTPALHARSLKLGQVTWEGAVGAERLEALYRGATGLLYPSLYEGFGLPVAEAFSRGVPVVASDIPTLGELFGQAAVLVDPRNPHALREAMLAIQLDPGRARELAQRGRARAAELTWERTARDTLALYERLAAAGRQA